MRSPGKILLDLLVPISAGHYLNPTSKSHSIAKTGNSKTMEVKQTRQKAGLVEQRSLFEGKKGRCMSPVEVKSGEWEKNNTANYCKEKINVKKPPLGLKMAKTVGNNRKRGFKHINGKRHWRS